LNWLSKEFLIAVIASLAIAIIALSLWGKPYNPPRNYGSQQTNSDQKVTAPLPTAQIKCDPNCTAKNPDQIRNNNAFSGIVDKFFDDPVIGLTGGILVANFLLVIVVILQVREAGKSAERELRAYLSVETGMTYRQSQKYHTRFEFRPNVVNNGKTPASNVRIRSNVVSRMGAVPVNFDFALPPPAQGNASVATIGPGKEKFHQSIFPRFLRWRELREHGTGNRSFHLWGEVTYDDIFKNTRRHTYFSFLIMVPVSKRGSVLWLATDRHNHYD
jgi:hypothetical protein